MPTLATRPARPAAVEVAPRWGGHPITAAVIRVGVVVVPLLASWGAVKITGATLGSPTQGLETLLWWIATIGAGLTAALLVDRLARRLLPLATLLQLTLLFPDQVPSRYRLWRTHRTEDELRRQIEHSDDPAGAAADVLSLVAQLDEHDRATRGHSERVRLFVELIADRLHLSHEQRDRLRWGALLHDVGKLDVDHDLLNKPGHPTDVEWEALRSHPTHGVTRIGPLAAWLGEWSLAIAHHHERHDGGGYPAGLAGDQISLAGRITSVADAFEVMTAARAYKKPMSVTEAREELVREAGAQFDPDIVRAFLDVSLPRLRVALGPTALAAQVPAIGFLARLPEQGRVGLMATATAGLTALAIFGNLPAEARPDLVIDASPPIISSATDDDAAAPAPPVTPDLATPLVPAAAGASGTGADPTTTGVAGPTAPGATIAGTTSGDPDAAPEGDPAAGPTSPQGPTPTSSPSPQPTPQPAPQPTPQPASGPDTARGESRVLVGGQGIALAIGLDDNGTPFVELAPLSDPGAPLEAGAGLVIQGTGAEAGVDDSGPYVRIITPVGQRAGHPTL